METVEFLAIPWTDYFDGKITIASVTRCKSLIPKLFSRNRVFTVEILLSHSISVKNFVIIGITQFSSHPLSQKKFKFLQNHTFKTFCRIIIRLRYFRNWVVRKHMTSSILRVNGWFEKCLIAVIMKFLWEIECSRESDIQPVTLSKEEILKAYQDHGFDANQDMPGNFCWEELYNASPKVWIIDLVRDLVR